MLSDEERDYLIKQYRKYRYRWKKAGRKIEDSTIINVIINRMI